MVRNRNWLDGAQASCNSHNGPHISMATVCMKRSPLRYDTVIQPKTGCCALWNTTVSDCGKIKATAHAKKSKTKQKNRQTNDQRNSFWPLPLALRLCLAGLKHFSNGTPIGSRVFSWRSHTKLARTKLSPLT